MRLPSRVHLLAVLLLCPVFSSTPVVGQAVVTGAIVEASTGRPIVGALVVLDTMRQVTAAGGRFRFTAVHAGARTLHISHLGYEERVETLDLDTDDHVELLIPIAIEPIALAPISVEMRSRRLLDVGYYDRAARGHGIYITRADLEASQTTRVGDYLTRIPGVRRAFVNGEMSRIDMRGGRSISVPCDTQFFVDGAAIAGGAATGAAVLESLAPQNVEAIEIYRGASETPIQFDFGRTSCGAIVIWTRRY